MAKGNKIGKTRRDTGYNTGQSLGRPKVEDPEEMMNAAMMKKGTSPKKRLRKTSKTM